jgi:hypothetical protein
MQMKTERDYTGNDSTRESEDENSVDVLRENMWRPYYYQTIRADKVLLLKTNKTIYNFFATVVRLLSEHKQISKDNDGDSRFELDHSEF